MTAPTARDEATPVLVVDDNPSNLLAVRAVLEPLELDVVTVESGEAALRALLSNDFAVILLDIQMPVLDGFETARLIKSRVRTQSIPIIFLTALDRDLEHELQGYGAGAVDYLSKPFHPTVLRSKVSVFVELHRNARTIEAQRSELAERLDERDVAQAALRAQAIELARSNAELERFAAVASHELQEPLDVVAGLVEVAADRLASGAGGDADVEAALGHAGAALRKVRTQLDDLLAYAEAGTAELHVVAVDLHELVEEVLREQAASLEEVGASVTCDPLPVVHADRWQLGLVLSNLVDNAVRYRGERPLAVHIGLSRVDDSWVLSVADNGAGIDDEALSTLFTAFRPGSEQAGGIGLALCRRILERHGGSIEATSVPGQGTTLSLRLPTAAPST